MYKDPVELNDSTVLVEGEELDYDSFAFWSDTFRNTDLLRYQSGPIRMMFDNKETTTFELLLEATAFPEHLKKLFETGKRFHIRVENEYFDLDVPTARVEKLKDGKAVIVAKVLERRLCHL